MFYACKCSLVLSITYCKNIQSPAVTRCRIPGIFCHQIQNRWETDHIPGDYLVTLFSFGRFIRQENPIYRFLKSGNNITAIFTKSTRYCACLNQIIPDWSDIKICWQRAKKLEVERRYSQGLDSYSSLSYKSCFIAFWQGKDYSNKVFLRYAERIRAFWRKYLIKYHLLMIWSAIYANWRYKGNIQETYTTEKSRNWFM